ncbi:hypothetical protein [Dyadobacter sp. Leaf189]|uniref:hypothetical protein n=1 Tax=Dyadobacter sp. Leaf189 TaxID=1736295 RepID=UPI0006FC8CAE|nr:hypothetical protein [Dyadobacter sp. Leaf189]KQS28051.1 hypothetical protein ASG33_16825 [Dyadobacter sp. Leaf189]
MKYLPLFLFTTLLAVSANAQSGKNTYQVKTGNDANKVIPYEGRYQFPDFRDGEVFFRNGNSSRAKMNYNRVHGEVMFISPARDTMLFANADYINHILIANDIFYYQKGHGHVRLERDLGDVKLGRKEFLAKMDHEKNAAYGQYSSTSAISSYSTFVNSTGEYQFLNVNERVMLARRAVFFFIDKNNILYVANRNNLLKVFPSKKSAVNKYLRENQVNFESAGDLEKAIVFCNEL